MEEFDPLPVVGDDAVEKVPLAVENDCLSLSLMGVTEPNTEHGVVKDAAISVGKQSRKADTINESVRHTPRSRRHEPPIEL